MSRFLDGVQEAVSDRPVAVVDPRPQDRERDSRPFQVLTVTSNKGGVGKTTVATNLAVYLRALREDQADDRQQLGLVDGAHRA